MSEGKVVEDLQKERNKCDFNIEELTNYLEGGAKYTNIRRAIENKVLSVKGLLDDVPQEYLSHKEKYEDAVRKSVLFYHVLQEAEKLYAENDDEKEKPGYRSMIMSAVFKESSPFLLHRSMFIPTLKGQGDEKQKEYWLKRANNMEIIGTYSQTELGHGTFIRGLETTATYDPDTEEFILHSPTLSSYKWWPGGLGHTVNYSIVMAQLYVKGKNYGIQPFIVQIRDEETHMPLPGIKVGEIGAKLGFNTVNNGFLGFDHHRIGRDKMLMKNAQVLKDGTFKAVSHSKLTYGTMVHVRVTIVFNMADSLSKAATIAVRYSAVRRQSQLKPDEAELQILDYVTQQHKLFIAIATSHALIINARWLWEMYSKVTKEITVGNTDHLPELHATSCCLKAVSTLDATKMIEVCRLACGGHGYIMSSNLPQTYGQATAAYTYEGENTVLMLQTARALVKAWEKVSKGETLSSTFAYLSRTTPVKKWNNSVNGIVEGFQKVAIGKLSSSVRNMENYMKKGASPEDAWNMTSIQLVAAAEAHCRAVILVTYQAEIERASSTLSAPLSRVLGQLVHLYNIYWALEKLGDLLLYTSITENDVQELQSTYEDLLGQIKHNAVGLVDAFDIRDEILNSALGAYDGRVYERLMSEALKSPLNKEPVNISYHKYLKPFMQGKL